MSLCVNLARCGPAMMNLIIGFDTLPQLREQKRKPQIKNCPHWFYQLPYLWGILKITDWYMGTQPVVLSLDCKKKGG